jgi:outer membrane protein TolC
LILLASAALSSTRADAQVSFGTAVDLALRNSDTVQIALAEQAKAKAVLQESKDVYIPTATFGSGLAYTNGFPIGDPSVVRMTGQGLVANFSQPSYIHSAAAGYRAATYALEDVRQQVILDAAQSYTELDTTQKSLDALKQEEDAAHEFVRITQDRVDSGVQSQLDSKKAQLRAAQVRLRRLELESRADVLREHLASLTGVPASSFTTDSATIPSFPAPPPAASLRQLALDSSAAIKSAYELAKSKQLQAKGDHRVELRPEIDLAIQYGYFSDFNNYSEYYKHFTNSNVAAGVQITLPIFSAAVRAKARESDADAAKASHQLNLASAQVSEQVVQLARSVEQTDAAAAVARLQHEISSADLDAMKVRAAQGSTGPNGAVVTPNETAGAQIEERGLYVDFLNAEWEHTKAELSLMHATGTLADWAKAALTLTPPSTQITPATPHN